MSAHFATKVMECDRDKLERAKKQLLELCGKSVMMINPEKIKKFEIPPPMFECLTDEDREKAIKKVKL
jgi:hypothetical protein